MSLQPSITYSSTPAAAELRMVLSPFSPIKLRGEESERKMLQTSSPFIPQWEGVEQVPLPSTL